MSKLSPKKERIAQLMALGRSVPKIAEMDDIDTSTATIYRWHREDFEFRERVRTYRQEILNVTLGSIVSASEKASEVLLEIATDKNTPAHARVSAASKILDLSKIAYDVDIQSDLDDLKESFLKSHRNHEE